MLSYGVSKMSVGSRIKQARVKSGLTRADLAEQLNITPSAISNYENGISTPRQDILCEIIGRLGVDANFLYQDVATLTYAHEAVSVVSEYENKYRALDERGRETVDRILEYEFSRTVKSDK